MPLDKLKTATDAYACFASGDIAGFFRDFDDNSALIEATSLPYGGEHRGVSAVGAALKAIGGIWTDIKFDVVEVIAGEKIAVAYGIFSAKSRATGKSIDMPLAEIWEFNADKVKSVTPLYFDTAAALAALS